MIVYDIVAEYMLIDISLSETQTTFEIIYSEIPLLTVKFSNLFENICIEKN